MFDIFGMWRITSNIPPDNYITKTIIVFVINNKEKITRGKIDFQVYEKWYSKCSLNPYNYKVNQALKRSCLKQLNYLVFK